MAGFGRWADVNEHVPAVPPMATPRSPSGKCQETRQFVGDRAERAGTSREGIVSNGRRVAPIRVFTKSCG